MLNANLSLNKVIRFDCGVKKAGSSAKLFVFITMPIKRKIAKNMVFILFELKKISDNFEKVENADRQLSVF